MDPRIVVWVRAWVRVRVSVSVRGKMGWIHILTVQEPAAWLPKLSINEPVEHGLADPGQPVSRSLPSVKMAFFDLRPLSPSPSPGPNPSLPSCLAPSILAAAGTILDVLQDIVDHAGRRNRRRGCGPPWSVVVSSDLYRPGTTLAQPGPAQRDPDPSPQAPWPQDAGRCAAPESMGLLCRGSHDRRDSSGLPSTVNTPPPTPLADRLAGWLPSDGQHSRLACFGAQGVGCLEQDDMRQATVRYLAFG